MKIQFELETEEVNAIYKVLRDTRIGLVPGDEEFNLFLAVNTGIRKMAEAVKVANEAAAKEGTDGSTGN